MNRSGRTAYATLAVVLSSFTVLFHVAVLVGLVPFRIVWGGQLANRSQMRALETVSLSLNLSILWLVSMEAGYTERRLSDGTLRASFRALAGLFALNTVGNVLSKSTLERVLFTPITLLLALSFWRLARARPGSDGG